MRLKTDKMKKLLNAIWIYVVVDSFIGFIIYLERETDTRLFDPEALTLTYEELNELIERQK